MISLSRISCHLTYQILSKFYSYCPKTIWTIFVLCWDWKEFFLYFRRCKNNHCTFFQKLCFSFPANIAALQPYFIAHLGCLKFLLSMYYIVGFKGLYDLWNSLYKSFWSQLIGLYSGPLFLLLAKCRTGHLFFAAQMGIKIFLKSHFVCRRRET